MMERVATSAEADTLPQCGGLFLAALLGDLARHTRAPDMLGRMV